MPDSGHSTRRRARTAKSYGRGEASANVFNGVISCRTDASPLPERRHLQLFPAFEGGVVGDDPRHGICQRLMNVNRRPAITHQRVNKTVFILQIPDLGLLR